MPFTFNGFGTAYRGQKDVDENGCYVTTLFIVAAFLPIVPLASYIVRPHGGAVPIPMARIQGFDAVQIKMDFRQVLSVYLRWYVGAAVGVAALFLFMWTYIHFLYPEKEKLMKHASSAKVVVARYTTAAEGFLGQARSTPRVCHARKTEVRDPRA